MMPPGSPTPTLSVISTLMVPIRIKSPFKLALGIMRGGGIRVDDRFNIIVVDGDGTNKKDATIYEAMAKNVLAVVSDVGDFDWSAIIIEDENSASLSNATLAHLPDIA